MVLTQQKRFLVDGIWVVAGQGASALGALVGLRMLTGLLSPETFGEVVLVLGIVLMADGVAAGPLMQAVVKYYPEAAVTDRIRMLRDATNTHLRKFTIASGLLCFCAFLIYSWLASASPWISPLAALLLVVEVRRQHETTLLNAARSQQVAAIWGAAEAWSRPVSAWALIALFGPTAVATLSGFIFASAMNIALFRPWSVHANDRTPSESSLFKGQVEKQLLQYSLPLIPLGIIDWITSQADRYLIGAFIGVEQAGLYASVYGLVSRPFLMAGGALELWIRPVYYNAILSASLHRERLILRFWLASAASMAVIGTVVFSLWHTEIAAVLLAAPYRQDSGFMPWIAAGYGFLLVAHVYGRVCYAHHDTRAVLLAESTGSAVSLIAMAYGLVHFGVSGAAYAVPVYFGAQLVAAKILAQKADAKRDTHPLGLTAASVN